MQMREVGTKYLFKTWSWTKPTKTKGRVRQVLSSEAHERQALFNPQEISQNLASSYDLGSGKGKEVDGGDGDTETSRRLHEVLHQHQQAATKKPSTAQVFQKQAAHAVFSSPEASITAAAVPLRGSKIRHNTETRQISAPSAFVTQKVNSLQGGSSQDRQPSRSPLRTARPTQRQSIEGNAEYSVGAPTNNGGKLHLSSNKSVTRLHIQKDAGLVPLEN
jgi:hypothetical protein